MKGHRKVLIGGILITACAVAVFAFLYSPSRFQSSSVSDETEDYQLIKPVFDDHARLTWSLRNYLLTTAVWPDPTFRPWRSDLTFFSHKYDTLSTRIADIKATTTSGRLCLDLMQKASQDARILCSGDFTISREHIEQIRQTLATAKSRLDELKPQKAKPEIK